jgi:hypothetical protein
MIDSNSSLAGVSERKLVKFGVDIHYSGLAAR